MKASDVEDLNFRSLRWAVRWFNHLTETIVTKMMCISGIMKNQVKDHKTRTNQYCSFKFARESFIVIHLYESEVKPDVNNCPFLLPPGVFPCFKRHKINSPRWFSVVSAVVSLRVILPAVFFCRVPCVIRLTTDQAVMSRLSPLQSSNLEHLVILGVQPQQCWVKPTLWAGARGWLTDRQSAEHTLLNWMNCRAEGWTLSCCRLPRQIPIIPKNPCAFGTLKV